METPVPFIGEWEFISALGEGAFAEVKLIQNSRTKQKAAAKVIFKDKCPDFKMIEKEVVIMKLLKHHPNIIEYFGTRVEAEYQCLFLEYACGGELFDRIEPDFGMPVHMAQRYFQQLINGVEFIHAKGVCHRDIKPENLLLDANDNIKISDFGMATVFRANHRERMLNSQCGTTAYAAPEVMDKSSYKAEPVDIWSCGIVLVAMLTGELPWDGPNQNCREYNEWKDNCNIGISPWLKMDTLALSLLRPMLSTNPESRITLMKIKEHRWFKKVYSHASPGVSSQPKFVSSISTISSASSAALSDDVFDNNMEMENVENAAPMTNGRSIFTSSQPVQLEHQLQSCHIDDSRQNSCFSQPINPESMLLSSQHGTQQTQSQAVEQDLYQRLVRRMTRFFVSVSPDDAVVNVVRFCMVSKYYVKKTSPSQVTVETQDRRMNNLAFKVNIYNMRGEVLVDVRLSKGDGLEFKRLFMKLKDYMKKIITHEPESWLYK